MNSILTSVKKLLGIAEECTDFDTDIIMYINMALFALVQMGVGPGEGYAISGKENEWTEFVADPVKVEAVKAYVAVKVRLLGFDPPQSSTTMIDAAGSFAGSASLYKVNPAAVAAFQMFSVASFATGQYFLADISSKLTEVNRKLDDLLAFLQASKRTELLSELTFVKYALANYATIMLSEPQRIATIGNLQRAKIKAVADIEFYTEQLESSAAAKSNENQAKTVLQNKQGIDLASQLYAISTIMEAYYSQNWNQSYLANISADAKPLFALTQNRMISAITKFSDRISKDLESKKKGLLKGDVSQSEHKVLKLYDTLNSQSETPLLAFIEEALDKPSEPSELYLRSDGSVYQKI
jgi:hypothetical protein